MKRKFLLLFLIILFICSGCTMPWESEKPLKSFEKPTIDKVDISVAEISAVADQKYTGSEINPKVTITINGENLIEDVDYTLNYQNNIDVGTATVTATGIGNYIGVLETPFEIIKVGTTKPKAKITCANKEYSGEEQVIASCSGGTISGASQTKAGEYKITCKGDSSHTDAKSKTCKINKIGISKATIASIASQKRTGKEIKPTPAVTLDNKTLIKDVDYTLNYKNNIDVGTATVVVTGKGNYAGTIESSFEIIDAESSKVDAVITCTNKTYTGSVQTIASCSGGTISNASQTKAGDYTITCKGDNNHTDAISKTCSINKADISKAIVSAISSQTHTGKEIKPTPAVTLNNKNLVKDTDYILNYENNINVGTAAIVITGRENYTGSKEVTFKIVAATLKTKAIITCVNSSYTGSNQTIATCSGGAISNANQTKVGTYTITCKGDSNHTDADSKSCNISRANISKATVAAIASQTYTGKAITPTPVITFNSKTLVKDTDYTLTYKNNINVGTGTIVITGEGNYIEAKEVTFKITEEKTPAVITCTNKTYTGSSQTIATCSGGTISGANQTKVGNYQITCKGDSKHTDAESKSCSISKADISKATAKAISGQKYTGSAITPTLTITIDGKTLAKDTDYVLSYKDNIKVGTATITATGKGNYTGTKEVTFEIMGAATITCTNKSYTGSSQTIATCTGGTISNASQTKVGNYNITCKGDSKHTDAESKSCSITKANISKTTVATIASQTYTGKEIKPTPAVTFNNKNLVKDTDYTLSYANNIKVGTATITVTGKGNYTGTKEVTFKISEEKSAAIITCQNKVYNGSSQTIATCSGGTISNANQTKAGDYTITCKGNSTHKDAESKTCSITKLDLSKATVSTINNQAYTGKEIKPTPTVTLNNKTLVKDTDYTLSYANNIKAGTATITVTGKGNYKGSQTVTFKILESKAVIACQNKIYNGSSQTIATCSGGTISGASQTKVGDYTITCKGDSTHKDAESKKCSIVKADLTKATVFTIKDQTYTGKQIKPTPTVTLNNKTLVKDTDYTLSYANNIKAGTATITVTGKGNYKGSQTVTFKILESKAVITCANKIYNGTAQVIASCSGGTISNNKKTNVGSYTVKCKGDENHTDAVSKLCSINAAELSKATVSKIGNQTYTGKQITPAPTIKVDSRTLKKDTDYTLSYSNNIKVGTASVTISGKGNYKGTKVVTFKIVSIPVTKVTLNKTSLILIPENKNESSSAYKMTLKVTISPSNATNKKVTWSSSNSKVVTVDNGTIIAKSPGTATITVKANNGKAATATVTVESNVLKNIYEITPTKLCVMPRRGESKLPMQGIYFYKSGGKEYALYAGFQGDDNKTEMTLVNLNDCKVITKNNTTVLGHANDISYFEGKYYVTLGKTAYGVKINNNKEIVVDKEATKLPVTISGFEYDRVNKKFYSKAGNFLYTFPSLTSASSAVKHIETFPNYYSNIEGGNTKVVNQSLSYSNGNIYLARTISSETSKYRDHSYIMVYDAKTAKYKYTMHFAGDFKGHLEGVSVIGNTLYMGLNFHRTNPTNQTFLKYDGLDKIEKKYLESIK